MRITFLILLTVSLISCNSETKNIKIEFNQKELNQIVDEIILNRFEKVSLIQIETKPIYKSISTDTSDKNSSDQPPPVSIVYSKSFFETMIEKELLDKTDANFMYSNIDSSKIYYLDSTIISKPTVSKNYLDSLFSNDLDYAYNYLRKRFATSCFLRIGTPTFNQTLTKMILSIDYYCRPEYGEGYIFVLKKVNGKWTIINELRPWIS